MSTAGYIWYWCEAVLILILTLIIYVIYTLHQQHKKYDFLPGPPRDSFFLGNYPSVLKLIRTGKTFGDYLVDMTNIYGSPFRINLLNKTYVVVTNPEGVKKALVTTNYPKCERIYKNLHFLFGVRFLGTGVAVGTDQKLWVKKRMIFDKWFRPMSLRKLAADMTDMLDAFINQLHQYADGKTPVRMTVEYANMTLKVFCKLAYGLELSTAKHRKHPFVEAQRITMEAFGKSTRNPFIQYNPMNWKFCRDARNACTYMRTFAKEHIRKRKEAKKMEDYVPDDLLDFILKAGEELCLDEEELVDEFIGILSAGHETVTALLSFVTFSLAQHQDCLKKLRDEIDENVGAKAVITHEDIGKLPYLDSVIKETLRMYSPVAGIFRETRQETQQNGFTIPSGTEFCVSMYAAARCKANFKDPEKFIPERHYADSEQKVTKYMLFPFSIGPMNCLGQRYAEDEAKTTLVKLIQTFDFELVPGQNMDVEDNSLIQLKGQATCYLKRRMEI